MLFRVRGCCQHVFQLHPLGGEGVQKTLDLGVGEHPLKRAVECVRFAESAGRSQFQELLVWQATPEKKRQVRGELERCRRTLW